MGYLCMMLFKPLFMDPLVLRLKALCLHHKTVIPRLDRGICFFFIFMVLFFPMKAMSDTVILPPDESKTIGQKVPNTLFFDERGQSVRLDAFLGKPVVISPIFTQCYYTCPIITQSLKEVILNIPEFEKQYGVISLSFDVADTPKTLKAFQGKEKLPFFWKVVGATKENLFPFLNALDFKFMTLEEGGFAHPNLIIILGKDHKVSSYLYGTSYSIKKLKRALERAQGNKPPETWTSYIFLFFLFGFIAALTFIVFRINLYNRSS
ncbi:MAG TPA: hypothetical protein DD708_08730 [Deltaproteobacteria bacterium]|nr:hypothetical protein [Deltaproteobacteria bacterium]